MNTPSFFEQQGLVLLVGDPVIFKTAGEGFNLAHQVQGYSHTNGAQGGYLSCKFTITPPEYMLSEWLENGLCRDVRVVAANGDPVWHGWINSIELQLGFSSITLGPVVEIANLVGGHYTVLNTAVDPPIEEGDADAPLQQDTISIARYGSWEKWFDIGTRDPAVTAAIIGRLLTAKAWPAKARSYSMPEPTALTINCLGYYAWLSAYTYNNNLITKTTASSLIADIVYSADPNDIFAPGGNQIGDNPVMVDQYYQDEDSGLTIIENVLTLGDGTDTPWLFYVTDGRVPNYQPMPAVIEYELIAKASMTLQNQYYRTMDPWLVQAGRWMFMPDLQIAAGLPGSLDDLAMDPRAIFINTCTYTMPHDLELNSISVSRLPQYLAQLGLGNL